MFNAVVPALYLYFQMLDLQSIIAVQVHVFLFYFYIYMHFMFYSGIATHFV